MDRVQKIIAQSGLCSRRKAEELIEAKKVKVNGVLISLGDKADPKTDKIIVDGKELTYEPQVYYMLHKPRRYITTSDDMYGRNKVLDIVPKKPRVFSVGRLDRDATGLLLLTNDGDFAQNVTHPSKVVEKTYIAILDQKFSAHNKRVLEKGVVVDKHVVKPKVVLLDEKTIAITLHVGIHKVVKRMLKSVGFYVKQLHRTHIGSLALDVPVGEYRVLSKEDLKKVFEKSSITKETFSE